MRFVAAPLGRYVGILGQGAFWTPLMVTSGGGTPRSEHQLGASGTKSLLHPHSLHG